MRLRPLLGASGAVFAAVTSLAPGYSLSGRLPRPWRSPDPDHARPDGRERILFSPPRAGQMLRTALGANNPNAQHGLVLTIAERRLAGSRLRPPGLHTRAGHCLNDGFSEMCGHNFHTRSFPPR